MLPQGGAAMFVASPVRRPKMALDKRDGRDTIGMKGERLPILNG